MKTEIELRKELAKAKAKVRKIKTELRRIGSDDNTNRRKRYIYVLKCKGDRYYIGQTVNLNRRMREHLDGTGGWFTAQYPPIGMIDNFYAGYLTESQALHHETQTTARYMDIYSIDRVRGGMFNTRDKKYWENKVCEWKNT